MSKIFCLLVFQILILHSCSSPKTLLSDLVIKDFKYYKKASNNLFTGTAITNFDNGNLSSTIEIKEGVPNGKWFAYGYKGEIVQEGTYTPIDISNNNFLMQKKIRRLNICFGKEGPYVSTDIYVIVDTNRFSIDTTNLTSYIKAVCKQKSVLPLEDRVDIKITTSELN